MFLDPPPPVIKSKNKWNLIKLKSFCIAKETIHKMRRQSSEWEEVFENEAMKKGLNLQNTQAAHAAQYKKKWMTQSKSGPKS